MPTIEIPTSKENTMGNCISGNPAEFVHMRVKENGHSANLWVNRAGDWIWEYNVKARTAAESQAINAALERQMEAKVRTDPRFDIVPHDRLKRHFAKYNRQFDSQGREIIVGPPRPARSGRNRR